MKRNRLIAGAVCAAVAGTLALTACSDGGDGGSDGGDKQITFMFRGGPDEKAAYEAAIKKYTADTGVKVKVIVTDADQYATKLQAAVAGNNVPDVFYIEQASLQSYVSSGVLADITDQVEASGIDLDNIWPYGVDSYRFDGTLQGTPDGKLYGLPKDVGPFSFGYNKTMLEAAGIPLPDKDTPLTWDQFVDISKQLTVDTDGDGAVDQWGTGLNVQWNLQSLVWSNGGDWTNEDRTEVTVDTPEFADALQKFADLTNVDKVTPSASDAATLDTYQRWMAGEIGFFPVGPWDVSVYNDLDFDYDLIPWPTVGDGGAATWVGSLGIGVSAHDASTRRRRQARHVPVGRRRPRSRRSSTPTSRSRTSSTWPRRGRPRATPSPPTARSSWTSRRTTAGRCRRPSPTAPSGTTSSGPTSSPCSTASRRPPTTWPRSSRRCRSSSTSRTPTPSRPRPAS